MFKRLGRIQSTEKNPAQYDLVILGTPVWMMNLSAPMRGFIAKQKNHFTNVAFFCTEGGSGGTNVFKVMTELCGKQPVATLEITESELKSGADTEKVKAFTRVINQSSPKGVDALN